VAELLDVIAPLSDPGAHGGHPADAFHLVIPSVPGYGFSGPVAEAGWNLMRVARAWAELMHHLGYDRYLAQGGDFGALVSLALAAADPEHVAGVHVNFLPTAPSGDPELDQFTESDLARLQRASRFIQDESGYMKLQSTRPQTVAWPSSWSPCISTMRSTIAIARLFEQHVDACTGCTRYLAQIRQTIDLTRRVLEHTSVAPQPQHSELRAAFVARRHRSA
jgi:pimeloyl-ACP methyl ester carboxylesterase